MPAASKTPTMRMSEQTVDGDVIIGRVRPKNNPLIHRSEVGRPSFHNDLPPLPEDYTFGAPLKRDAEGAGDVMLTWQVHQPPKSKMSYDFGRDFLKLNKKSATSGLADAKAVAEYRKANDARIKPKVTGVKPTIAPSAVMNDPTHAFGKTKAGQSESVADLIQNRYENEWVQEQKARMDRIEYGKFKEAARRSSPERQAQPRTVLRRTPTVTTPTPHPKETFTLKQFKGVTSRYAASPSHPVEGPPRAASATLEPLTE